MTALTMSTPAQRTFRGEALAKLAELRLAQGRIGEAERLVEGFEDHPAVAAAIGTIHLARGEPGEAAAILRRRTNDVEERSLERAAPLELLVEAEVAQGATDAAAARANRLAELGARLDCDAIVARGERALGRVFTATGDAAAARPLGERARRVLPARDAVRGGSAPASSSRSCSAIATTTPRSRRREALSPSLRISVPPIMRTWRRRSCARWGPRRVALGVEASAGSQGSPELEVLRLIGEGLSNREMAERLFVSRKTVEHHVARVLSKLELRSRAEAAAYAARNLERDFTTE
jgi:DNA-binding CsgD family transcriptional regulator